VKVEWESDRCFSVYINNLYLKLQDWDDKEEITKNIKQILLKLHHFYHLELQGFYKMTIFVNRKVGLFLLVECLEDEDFNFPTVDLRLVIYLSHPFYLCVEDVDMLEEDVDLYFYKGKCYLRLDEMRNDQQILSLLEYGNLVCGELSLEIRDYANFIVRKK